MNYKNKRRSITVVATLLLTLGIANHPIASPSSALAHTPQTAQASPTDAVPLFNNLGNYYHEISTKNPQTQRYFDQGLILSYGFNHAEALRSFQQAAALDRTCAMCYWGMAYVLGPNINAAMADGVVPPAWEAIQKATALK